MRQSSAANRTSYATGISSQANNAVTVAKLLEKKKEYDAVAALDRASTLYYERVAGLAEDCDVMALAGEAHGQVLQQWTRMFHILNLFLKSRESSQEGQPDTEQTDGQMLVRIPIEDLLQENSQGSSE